MMVKRLLNLVLVMYVNGLVRMLLGGVVISLVWVFVIDWVLFMLIVRFIRFRFKCRFLVKVGIRLMFSSQIGVWFLLFFEICDWNVYFLKFFRLMDCCLLVNFQLSWLLVNKVVLQMLMLLSVSNVFWKVLKQIELGMLQFG